MEGFSKPALASICAVALAMLIHLGQAQNLPDYYLTPLNEARAAVGVGPMTWDATVAAFAQSYAYSRIGDCALQHSENPMYGETIFWGGGDSWSAGDAASTWVEEKQYYDYKSNTCSAPADESCGHYTQVVWRNSTQLGCARVECANGDTFITCNYYPSGNVGDERPY